LIFCAAIDQAVLSDIAGALAVLVGEDHPTRIRITNRRQLADWGRPDSELLRTAIDNLLSRSAKPFTQTEEGFFSSPATRTITTLHGSCCHSFSQPCR
jgi:hypothetical protein